MLILHRSSHISVAHRLHNRRQIASIGEHPGSIVVPGTVHDQFLRELSFSPSEPELLAQVSQVTTLRSRRRKQPTLCFAIGANSKQFVDAVAHRNHSSSLWRLAVGYENDSVASAKILDTYTVEFSPVPHPGVPSKDDDIPKQMEHCRLPVARFGSQQQFLLSIIV
jgi:hypothetical protein